MLGYLVGITLVLTALSPLVFENVFADSLSVTLDKSQYNFGDEISISGQVFDYTMPIIAMSLYDPDGKILVANNLEISSQNTFEKTISLDSPFYEKTGEYLLKFDYGQISQEYSFQLGNEIDELDILLDESVEPEIILLYTEKNQYTDKDVIKITGLVSAIDSPTVLIGVYDPFGMPAGFYFGTIDSNLEFTTSFLVKSGVNFRVDGTYSVKAHYAETEVTSFFEYFENLPETIEEPITVVDETTNETIEEPIETVDDTVNKTIEEKIVKEKQVVAPENKKSENETIIQTTKENKVTKEKEISKNDSKSTVTKEKTKKQNNLTVEDIELGKLLNQINLECDSSRYTDTISYYDGMGPALYRLCKFDNSLNFFNESLIKNPDDVEILVNKGSTLGKLGYFSEAIVYYDHAINVEPSFLPAKNNKANALANLGHLDDAILLYNEILEENPNYITAKKNLKTALSQSTQTSQITNVIQNTNENNEELFFEKEIPEHEQKEIIKPKKQTSKNFFDEVSVAFSSLGSLFGFLN